MKRFLTSLVVLCLCGIAIPLGAQTAETDAATIFAGSVRGIPGSTVIVSLSLTHTGVVSALQFDANYPAAKLNAGSFQSGLLSNNVVLRSRQITPGQYRVLLYDKNISLLNTNSSIGGLAFSIPAGDLSAGGPVAISNALMSTAAATAVQPIRLINGAVVVGQVVRGADGVVDLFLTVQSNRTYVIQATTNFNNWANLATNFTAQNYIVFKDTEAVSHAMRFYRAVPVGAGAGGLIESLQITGGGFMTFSYPTANGRTYVMQATTNLSNWLDLQTNIAASAAMNFTNLIDPAHTKRFFRIIELP